MSIFDASVPHPGTNITGNQVSGDVGLGLYDIYNYATPDLYQANAAFPGLATPTERFPGIQGQGAWDY